MPTSKDISEAHSLKHHLALVKTESVRTEREIWFIIDKMADCWQRHELQLTMILRNQRRQFYWIASGIAAVLSCEIFSILR
jgi:hypothetical protein